jgi:hypothetical protein
LYPALPYMGKSKDSKRSVRVTSYAYFTSAKASTEFHHYNTIAAAVGKGDHVKNLPCAVASVKRFPAKCKVTDGPQASPGNSGKP